MSNKWSPQHRIFRDKFSQFSWCLDDVFNQCGKQQDTTLLIVSSHLGLVASFWATDMNPAKQRDPLDTESRQAGPIEFS